MYLSYISYISYIYLNISHIFYYNEIINYMRFKYNIF